MSARSTSTYEEWARRLRQWQRDPSTPLHDLPVLHHETFTPTTYQRLLNHIEKALEAVTLRWSKRVTEAFTRVAHGNDLARELVALRPLLARRVQLAHHPHLPPALSDALRKECRQTLERLQAELEESLDQLGKDGKLSRAAVDTLLQTVRDNSLLRVLEMSIPQDGSTPSAPTIAHSTRFDAATGGPRG